MVRTFGFIFLYLVSVLILLIILAALITPFVEADYMRWGIGREYLPAVINFVLSFDFLRAILFIVIVSTVAALISLVLSILDRVIIIALLIFGTGVLIFMIIGSIYFEYQVMMPR